MGRRALRCLKKREVNRASPPSKTPNSPNNFHFRSFIIFFLLMILSYLGLFFG